MSEDKIKLFADCHCTLSESPMWNKKEKMLYWRGFEGQIYRKSYDEKTGELTNKRTFAKECCPDGIAVDTDGNVWVANCSPGQPLMCFNQDGQLIKEYYLPVYRVISVAFGGEDNELLFITTASEGHAVGEHDGGVFVIENEAVGAEEYIFPLKIK